MRWFRRRPPFMRKKLTRAEVNALKRLIAERSKEPPRVLPGLRDFMDRYG